MKPMPRINQQAKRPMERGPNGRWRCRNCGEEVPEGRRKSWCGKDCVDLYLISNDPGFARSQVWKRDEGVCALCKQVCSRHGRGPEGWEMDHTVPLIEGGVNTMENFRTLCVPCHKGETKELRGRMAQRDYTDRMEKKGHRFLMPLE